ncbi:MAG: hypothetical protein JSU98_08260 [Gemmatimonadales bacterium]|jgi:hypothetical protein|nr:MAG: hypothetical protein JSU98_08260 [Gemmatimonadales bacterium]
MKRLAVIPILAVLAACSGDVTSPQADDLAVERSMAKVDGPDRGAMMAAVAQHMMDNGRTTGAFFLPPFDMDDEGNLTFAGTSGFIFASFWPSGGLKGVCLFFSQSETNFFRVGPHDQAMNHVSGPASAGLFARFAEDGTPLPGLSGSGKLNMKIQGTLGADSFEDNGVTISFLYIDQPTSAQVWSGVGKVGEEGAKADQLLKCGFTDDAKGNRRTGHFSVK